MTAVILAGKGDSLPVSAFPIDGTWPTATSKWEKRNLALEIPVWDPLICIQCNKCAMVCPHAAIRVKVYPAAALAGAPATFKSTEFKATYCQGDSYSVQVAPEDCTGCTLCVEVCPAKDKKNPRHKAIDMVAQGAAARRRARQLRILPGAARGGPHQGAARREGNAVLRAAVRVFGRLRPAAARRPMSSC